MDESRRRARLYGLEHVVACKCARTYEFMRMGYEHVRRPVDATRPRGVAVSAYN